MEPTPPEASPKPLPEETEEEDVCKKTGNHFGGTLGSDCKVYESMINFGQNHESGFLLTILSIPNWT